MKMVEKGGIEIAAVGLLVALVMVLAFPLISSPVGPDASQAQQAQIK